MVDVKVKIDEFTAFPTMIYKFVVNLESDVHTPVSYTHLTLPTKRIV